MKQEQKFIQLNSEQKARTVTEKDMEIYLKQLASFLLKVFSENKVIAGGQYGRRENDKT